MRRHFRFCQGGWDCPNNNKYSPLEPSKLAFLTKFFTGLKTDAFYILFFSMVLCSASCFSVIMKTHSTPDMIWCIFYIGKVHLNLLLFIIYHDSNHHIGYHLDYIQTNGVFWEVVSIDMFWVDINIHHFESLCGAYLPENWEYKDAKSQLYWWYSRRSRIRAKTVFSP